jgi:ribonuclease HI
MIERDILLRYLWGFYSMPRLNWNEWVFTDGNCITNKENGSQSFKAGDHPQSNKITTANPGGTSINKTTNGAELAGIAAALINEHTHTATDSTMANKN